MVTNVSLEMNGLQRSVAVDTRATLADLIRDVLGLTGTHVGCATGNCGACTVLLDGETIKSCCVLAAEVDGRAVMTIEALSTSADDLDPVQRAFVEHQGLQCGFCTPGMVLSVVRLLDENPEPDDEEIRHAISGNLCRCTGYQFIVDAVRAAAELRAAAERPGAGPAGPRS
jgi:carbon-monoxide dehydrogenase small subunit